MARRSPISWALLAAGIAALAIYVNIPVALLVAAFVSGAPLFTIMLGATVLGAWSGVIHVAPDAEWNGNVSMIQHVGLGDQVETMSTIPLFIYAGYLLAESGSADRLVRFANALLGWLPGGLAIVTIGTCALYTVFTGASGVTIIALGGVLMPALIRQGYPERFSMGLIAGTGSVGLLFPPALPLFIFGTVLGLAANPATQAIWDTRRFLFAGIVPGMVLIAMLSAVAVTVAVRKRLPRQEFVARELARSFALALPELMVPFGVIIGLIKLHFGLPELAALTVVYTVVLEVGVSRLIPGWGKPLAPRVLWTTSREAIAMVGAIFIIIFASTVFTDFLVNAEVPKKLVDWTRAHVESRIVFLLAVNVVLLLVGTVMDIFSAIVVVLPLLVPIAEQYGVDPYHLGVIFLLNLEVGYLHPPVGLNLFITSVKFQRPITEVMWATIPFLATMIVALLTITYVPALTEISASMSPVDPARSGRVQDLMAMIHEELEKRDVVDDVALVTAAGVPINDRAGKPIHVRIADCAAIKEQTARDGCERPFFAVKECRGKPDAASCAHKAIAQWIVASYNATDDAARQALLVDEVALVSFDGAPVNNKAGAPIVKKLADCPQATDPDSCRQLFVDVSNCKISPPDRGEAACITNAIATWIDANQGDLEAH